MNTDNFKSFQCMGCGINTHIIKEYYMLKDSIWEIVNPKNRGMLCIGCVEHSLGQTLIPSDFTDCAINNSIKMTGKLVGFTKSPRLMNRLGY